MRKRSTAVLLAITAMAWSPAPALAGGAAPRPVETARASASVGFLSPDRKTWCSATVKEVGCVSVPGRNSHGAILNRDGKVVLCPVGSAGPGWKCFQNFDPQAPVLHYGRSTEIGGFACDSTRRGITCTLRSNGRGFRIDREAAIRLT